MIKLRIFIPTLLFFLIFSLIFCFFSNVFFEDKKQDLNEYFFYEAEKKISALKQVMVANIEVALSMQAYFNGSQFVSRDEFKIFSGFILNKHPEIQSLNWLPKISHQNRESYEEEMRRKGFNNFTILEKTVNNRLIPSHLKANYYPLHYLEPFEKNKMVFGMDSSSHASSLLTINKVMVTHQHAISPPLSIVQEPEHQRAILIFFPIYKENILFGFIEIVLRMGDVLEYTQKRFDLGQDVLIKLSDVSDGGDVFIATENVSQSVLYNEKIWKMADRVWKAEFYPGVNIIKKKDKLRREQYVIQFLVLSFGLFMSCLLYQILFQKSKAKENKHQFQLSQLHFKQLINQTADTYFLYDSSGKILDVNQRGCEMLGYTREEFLSLSILDITVESKYKRALLWDDVQSSNTISFEGLRIHKDGRTIPVEDNINHFLLDKKPVFSALSRDITNRILNTQIIQDARDKALEANIAKSNFLANMSHEMRTPMHGILSFTRLGIKNIDIADKVKLLKYFERINQSGERLLTLLNDLLDLSKIEAGKMTLEFGQHDFYSIIQLCLKEQEVRIQEKKLNIKVKHKEECIGVFDMTRIMQVMTNLLSNAIKFTPEGKVIEIHLGKDFLHNQPALCFSISDEGIGIPDKELKKIFDKFTQSSKTMTNSGGTGLGLPICQEIVNLHHGKIWAGHSEFGGAIVKFIIPVEPSENIRKVI